MGSIASREAYQLVVVERKAKHARASSVKDRHNDDAEPTARKQVKDDDMSNRQMIRKHSSITSVRGPSSPSDRDGRRLGGLGSSFKSNHHSIDQYDMGSVIGSGGFGVVRLAQMRSNKKYFAIKVMSKAGLVKRGGVSVRTAFNEKDMLRRLYSPFIVTLHHAMQDPRNVYLVMDYCIGGELFKRLRAKGRLQNNIVKFYACQVIVALEYMHSKNIAYRDLKPENVMLTEDGNIKLVDFGFAKEVDDKGRLYTRVGTAHYMAPEMVDKLNTKGYSLAVDWWALGCFIFELLVGRACFGRLSEARKVIYSNIMAGKYSIPIWVNRQARDLMQKLLTPDLKYRIRDPHSIKSHEWFRGVDWRAIEDLCVKPPFTPYVMGPGDKIYFEWHDPPDPGPEIEKVDPTLFEGF